MARCFEDDVADALLLVVVLEASILTADIQAKSRIITKSQFSKVIQSAVAMGSYSPSFERPTFKLFLNQSAAETESIRSLPDLILFNSIRNPQAIFCAQIKQSKTPENDFEIVKVTFLELAYAVERCCQWILSNIDGVYPAKVFEDVGIQKSPPLALFLESDLTLFIYIAALLTLNIPVSTVCSFTRLFLR